VQARATATSAADPIAAFLALESRLSTQLVGLLDGTLSNLRCDALNLNNNMRSICNALNAACGVQARGAPTSSADPIAAFLALESRLSTQLVGLLDATLSALSRVLSGAAPLTTGVAASAVALLQVRTLRCSFSVKLGTFYSRFFVVFL
jgi:hypothetical protein